MPYVTTEVEVWVDDPDLDDVSDSDLIYELKSRGYKINETSDEARAEFYMEKTLHDELFKLSRTYLTCSREAFDKQLKSLFREFLQVYV